MYLGGNILNKLGKLQSLILFIAIVIGILLGNISLIERYAESLLTPFLFIMLFGVFLNTPIQD